MVLIHGGQWPATASADGFAAIFDRLAASYHVYAFDKLGMGFTDAPKSAADYSMDAIIRHAYGFIRAVGITRAIVAGHSRGALPAVRIAVDHPELVTHLIVFDTNALAPDDVTLVGPSGCAARAQVPTREQIRAADMASILPYNKAFITDATSMPSTGSRPAQDAAGRPRLSRREGAVDPTPSACRPIRR